MHVQVSLTIEISATASLSQMDQQIQEAGKPAMREALKQAIRHREDLQVSCPHCGEKQRRLEGTMRRVIATVFGRVQVQRRRFRCQACQRRWCRPNATALVALRTDLLNDDWITPQRLWAFPYSTLSAEEEP